MAPALPAKPTGPIGPILISACAISMGTRSRRTRRALLMRDAGTADGCLFRFRHYRKAVRPGNHQPRCYSIGRRLRRALRADAMAAVGGQETPSREGFPRVTRGD